MVEDEKSGSLLWAINAFICIRQFDVYVFLLFIRKQISCLVFMPVALYFVFTARLPQFIFISDLLIYSFEINTENANISMLNNSQEKIELSSKSAEGTCLQMVYMCHAGV